MLDSTCAGLRVSFNGTRGRLEYQVVENTCVAGAATDPNLPHRTGGSSREQAHERTKESVKIVVHKLWGAPVEHHVPCDEAGHGGGDARMLRDLFMGDEADPLGRKADHSAGMAAVSVGIAANESYRTGQAIRIASLMSGKLHNATTTRKKLWAALAVCSTAILLSLALKNGMRSRRG